MMDDDAQLLQIEPSQLTFHFELKKQSSCLLHVVNKTTNYVAFKIKTTAPKKYCVRPNQGIVAPQVTYDVTVSMQAQQTAPLDFQCKDKFLIQSTIAPLGASLGDIFSKNSGGFQEKKLRVALLPPANEDLKQEDQHPSNSNQIHVKQDDQDPSNSNPNEAAGLSLAKAIEELNKEVEELKLNLSVMDYKLREPSMIMDFFLTKFSGPLAEQLRLMMEIEELKSRMNVMDLKLSVLPEKMMMQRDIIQILSSDFPNDIEEMDIVEGMDNDIEELKRKIEANNRHFSCLLKEVKKNSCLNEWHMFSNHFS